LPVALNAVGPVVLDAAVILPMSCPALLLPRAFACIATAGLTLYGILVIALLAWLGVGLVAILGILTMLARGKLPRPLGLSAFV